MSLLMPERLYRLLPAIHRLRDAGQGEPLRALLALAEAELERVEADIAGLHDNWFIETCDDWVVPYIGDLLGVRPLRPVGAGVSTRAFVANTIAYRRRKGTAVVLEQLARDVTGWPARAVEFFQRLATTQHMNHVRLSPPCTAALHDAAGAEQADGAFDPFAHSADVRRAARGGRYNIPHLGLFLWRLRSYRIGAGQPGDEAADFMSARDQGLWWSVHPAGLDAPLFNRERTETTLTHLAEEDNVPAPLRTLALAAELERLRRGVADPPPRFMREDDPALRVFVRLAGEPAPVAVPREDLYLCEIPDAVELASPPLTRVLALDPRRGRLAFPAGLDVREVWVQASHGFAGDLGGGPYDRNAAVREAGGEAHPFGDPGVWQAGVSHLLPTDGVALFGSLRAAVQAWNALPAGRNGVIVLMDSLSEFDTGGSPPTPLRIDVSEGSRLLVVAGLWPLEPVPGPTPGGLARRPGRVDARGVRAHFVGDLEVRGTAPAGSADPGECSFNGLMLEGRLVVAPGHLGRLALAHCSLLHGFGGLGVQSGGNERLRLSVQRSICPGIEASGPLGDIAVADSLIGSGSGEGSPPDVCLGAPEAALELARSSFLGGVEAQTLSATDCLFDGPLQVQRRQEGCVRFSYVPPGAATPRRYRCQPELETAARTAALFEAVRRQGREATDAEVAALRAEVEARVRPRFVSRRMGAPGFGQLERRCPVCIREGAESGAEMGAFEFLKQPQREANLRDALDEYLRFGLEAGLVWVT
jgi:hypothetical protein